MVVGNVSLSKVTANGSVSNNGIQISNVTGVKGVSLKGVEANNNGGHNLVVAVVSYDVIMSKIQADLGGSVGIYIQDVDGSKGVSLKDVGASTNTTHNIYISNIDPGDVVLNKVTANDSVGASGLHVFNAAAEVMVQNSFFNNNSSNGVETENVAGLVLLKKVQGNGSVNDSGAYLESSNFQLICSSQFIDNWDYGVYGNTPGSSLTIAGTDLSSIPNICGSAYATPGTTLWENTSSKCVVIPPP